MRVEGEGLKVEFAEFRVQVSNAWRQVSVVKCHESVVIGQGSGFKIQGSGIGGQGIRGIKGQGSWFRGQGGLCWPRDGRCSAGFRIQGAGFGIQCSVFRIQGVGCMV